MIRQLMTGCVALALLFASAVPSTAQQIDAKLIASGKDATGLVLQPSNEGSGTAFCIDKRGYFITNEHVVAGAEGKQLTLIMNPATDDEYELKAKIVDIDRENDLALLKADMGEHKPGVLAIGGDQPPIETSQLIAFGFPFGELLAFNGNYPAVSVNLGRVTSLRKRDGELRAIQTDTTLNFGNSGGPMLDTSGKVAGVVIAGLPGTGINFAIPAATVNKFLSTPRISFEPPAPIAYADRHKPLDLSIELDAFSPGDQPYEVTIEVELDGNTQGYTAKRNADGVYTARVLPGIAPPPAENADELLEIEVGFAHGRLGCRIKDLQLQLDKTAVALSEITLLDQRKDKIRIYKRDGSEITGDTLVAQAVNADLGGASIRLDLTKAQWLRIKHPDLDQADVTGYTAPLVVRVTQGGKTLVQDQATLQIMDPLARVDVEVPGFDDESPDLPGNALVFDARKDMELTGWESNFELPETEDGALLFKGNRYTALTYTKDIDLVEMSLEVESIERSQIVKVHYGENQYILHFPEDRISITKQNERPPKVEAALSGRIRMTIRFPGRELTTMHVGESVATRLRQKTGELSIRIDNERPVKIHRIELIPRNPDAPKPIAAASEYTPPANAAVVEQDDSEVKLAGPYQSFEVGGGGRYMLFHVPDSDVIQIVDVVKGGIVHTIDQVSDDVMIAAGLEHFVLVLPGQKIMQRWSFKSFEREKVARMPGEGKPWRVLLGASSVGPMVLCAQGNVFIDLESLREQDIVGEFWAHHPQHILEASTDGRTFMMQASPGRADNLAQIGLEEGVVWTKRFSGRVNTRHLFTTADGRLIFTNREFFDQALNPLSTDWLSELSCYPTVDPRYFVAVRQVVTNQRKNIHAIQLNICSVADRRVLYTETGFPEVSANADRTQARDIPGRLFAWRPHFHYVPWAKALATIGWDKASVRIRKFDLIEKLNSKGGGYLFVQSAPPVFAPRGGRLAYQVDVVSSADGVTYELLDGPKGATVSAEGLVSWEISVAGERDKETIILSIRNSADEEILHAFDLTYQ